jgi:hypothetical protein
MDGNAIAGTGGTTGLASLWRWRRTQKQQGRQEKTAMKPKEKKAAKKSRKESRGSLVSDRIR